MATVDSSLAEPIISSINVTLLQSSVVRAQHTWFTQAGGRMFPGGVVFRVTAIEAELVREAAVMFAASRPQHTQ